MIKHISILIWNQRRKYFAIITEQIFVFIILLICMISLFESIAKYRAPGLLDSANTVYVGYMIHDGFTSENMSQIGTTMDVIIENLKKRPYVEAISESIQFIPYLRPIENFWSDSLTLSSGNKIYAHIKATDAAAERVFRPKMEQGRWFQDGERPNGKYPAVITAQLAEKAQLDNPIGKTINMGSQAYEVIGVIAGLKESVFVESQETLIAPISSWRRISFYREYAARIQPGYEEEFFADYFKEFKRMGEQSRYVEPILSEMSRWEADTMTKTIMEVAFTTIPTFFLFIFAFLGVMGLNLINLKYRTKEFALRIALGSTRKKIISLILLQNIIISSIATVPGVILALSVYELNAISVRGIVFTIGVILLFAILSAFFPALTMSKMNPAESLKSE